MLKYHPYKSDKQGTNTISSQKQKYILGLVAIVILQFTKMNNGNKGLSIDTKQMKFGQNLAQIPPGFGFVGCSGIKPTVKESYMDIKEDSIYSIVLICILNKYTY